MAQYTEGQRLKGSDGHIYVVRNGVPMRDDVPLVSNPKLPLELRGAKLGNIKSENDIQTAPYNRRSAAANATINELRAKDAQEEYDARHVGDKFEGLTGPQLLSKLPANERALVEGMIQGRIAPPTGTAAKSPEWQRRLMWAAQIDPTFDTNNYNARRVAMQSIQNGAIGKSQNALNTAIGHASKLMETIDKVSSMGPFPLSNAANAVVNAYGSHSGEPGIAEWKYIAGVLGPEIETVYRNGGGSEEGVKRQIEDLGNPNLSAAAKREVIHTALDLLASKMAANYQQYSWAFKDGKPTWDMLDPDAMKQLKKFAPDVLDKYFAAPGGSSGGNGDGGIDRTNYGGGGAAPPGSTTTTAAFPEASALIDSMVARGVPYASAIRQYRQQFPDQPVFGPKQYNDALTYQRKHPNDTGGYGAATKIIPLSETEQRNNDLSQSAIGSFLGHAANATLAGIPAAAAGDQGAYWNALSQQQHGTASTLGDIGGAVAGTLGIGKGLRLGADALETSGSPVLQTLGKKLVGGPGRRALIADTTYGGTFGATQDPDNPMAGAALGAGTMALGNVAGRYALGPALGAAGNTRVGQKALGMFGATPAAKLPAADRIIAGQSSKAAPDVLSTLDEAANLNLPYALADAHPKLRALAGSAVRKSQDARTFAEDTITPRQLGQADRALGAIDTHLAPSGDLGQIGEDALTRARAAAQPFYEKAMQHPAPDDKALMDMLRTPAGESAAREAYQIALNKGENPAELSFHTLPDGTVRIDGMPNWRTLQYMKQGVDSVAEKSRNPVTGKLNPADPAAKGLQDFRVKFTGRLHALNDDFRQADAEFARFAGQGSAAKLGAAATAPRVTPETVQGVVGNMPPANLPFYRQGYASSLADRVENLNYSGDPYRAIYGSPAQRAKISGIFPEGAPQFDRINSLEGDMSKTAYETLGGSPTAARMEADKAFENGPMNMAGDLAFTAATGAPTPHLIQRGLSSIAGDTFKLGIGKSAERKAAQLGPILLNPDPAASAAYLRKVMDDLATRRAYMGQARAVGGMFAAPLAAPFIGNP